MFFFFLFTIIVITYLVPQVERGLTTLILDTMHHSRDKMHYVDISQIDWVITNTLASILDTHVVELHKYNLIWILDYQ
jgi:hypothetical protein